MTLGSTSAYQPLRAPRGATISCKGWQQEAVLRMLMNSLDPEVAERPGELVISGSAGKAAADWDSFNSIVGALRGLENTESLTIESGKLSGVSRSKSNSPRVLATHAASGGKSGDWLYTGTQSELPVLYELYASAARQHFGDTLAGKLVVGGGMGGPGGAQPLAAALHGAAFLGIDADAERIKRRVKNGYCEVMVNNLDEALRMLKNAVRQRKSVSIGLIGNCATLFAELAERGVVPDLLTDYTSDLPAAPQVQALCDLQKLGTRVLSPADCAEYMRPLIADGWRLTTWLALSGEPVEIARIDRLALELFPSEERIQHWLPIPGKHVRFQGLPARVAWLKQPHIDALALATNDLVARKQISAPILFGCRLPSGEAGNSTSARSENGSCWLWQNSAASSVNPNEFSAQAIVADGTTDAADRLAHWPAS